MAQAALPSLDNLKSSPANVMAFAVTVAKNDSDIPNEYVQELKNNLPGVDRPDTSREAFWELLTLSNRLKGIDFLHRIGMLERLLPCWGGNSTRQQLRLRALREYENLTWRPLLDEAANRCIDAAHEVEVEGRIARWGLTALAILLAGGDTENQQMWTKRVRRCLHDLGATEAEIVWIEGIVSEYRRAALFHRGELDSMVITPQLAVTILATMLVAGEDTKAGIEEAAHRAQAALEACVSPLDREADDDKDE